MTKLKKIKLSFAGCTNRDVALLNKQTKKQNKTKTRNCPTADKTMTGFCHLVIGVTLCNGKLLWCVTCNILLFLLLGDWTFIVNGRKRSYVLHAKLQEEATRWANAIQEVI